MTDLLKALEQAQGPSRELNEAIYTTLNPTHQKRENADPEYGLAAIYSDFNNDVFVPPYTASLDAALTLVPEEWARWRTISKGYITTVVLLRKYGERGADDFEEVKAVAYNEPCAMSIAAIKARARSTTERG